MKRWVVLTLIAGGAACLAAYVLVPRLFRPAPVAAPAQVQTPPQVAVVPLPASGVDSDVQMLLDDYHANRAVCPPPATRQAIGKLVARGTPGKAAGPLLEAWLKRMFDAGQADSVEFREFASALLGVDPEAPRTVVAAYRAAKFKEDAEYRACQLVAFGKASVPAVVDGMRQEIDDPHRAGLESWSKLPWVLAQLGDDGMAAIEAAFKADHPAQRRQAIRALVLLGPAKASKGLPGAVALLEDKDEKVRYLAALSLGELNANNAPPPGLVQLLKDANPVVRLAAAHALSRHAAFGAEELVPVLVALLKDNAFTRTPWDVEKSRHDSLYFWRALNCPYYQVFWEEATADLLIELGPKGQLPPLTIVELLKNCDHQGRHLVHLLMVQGENAQPAVPALIKMLKHQDAQQRAKALHALSRLGVTLAAEALPEIRNAMDDADPLVRWRALLTLAAFNPEEAQKRLPSPLSAVVASARLQPLEPHLAQGRIKTRCVWQNFDTTLQPHWEVPGAARAAHVLWTLSDEELTVEENRGRAVLKDLERVALLNRDAVPFLVAAWYGTTDNPKLMVNQTPITLKWLAELGPDAELAVPDLVRGLSWYDYRQIADVLVRVGPPAVPALARVLEDPAATDRHGPALKVLKEFGPDAKAAIPGLLQALRLESDITRMLVIETFGTLGEAGASAVPALQKLLGDKDQDVRRLAADALGQLGPAAGPALPELIQLFKDERAQLRLVAIRAVSRIGLEAVEPLKKVLAAPDVQTRLAALQALDRLGRGALGVQAEVQHLAESDADMAVRQAARELQGKLAAFAQQPRFRRAAPGSP